MLSSVIATIECSDCGYTATLSIQDMYALVQINVRLKCPSCDALNKRERWLFGTAVMAQLESNG